MAHTNGEIQQTLRQLHLWAGLFAGVFIVMMGLTGTVIVFKPALEGAAAPQTPSGGASPNLAAMEQGFAAAYPGARITRVAVPENSPGLLLVQAETESRQRVQAYFDAASGRDLGPKKSLSWLEWIVDLHQNLLMGKTGRRLTGVIGCALLFVGFSGIVSWLAGPRAWRRGLAIPKGGPWRRINYEWHRFAGLWANVLLLTVSATGIVLAYPDTFQAAVRMTFGEARLPREDRKRDADRKSAKGMVPLEAYVRAATGAIPEGIVRELKMPNNGREAVSVTLWTPSDIRPKGESVVLLSRATARVLSVDRSLNAPFSKRLVALANAIHKTELGGLPVKLVWSMLGLVPVLLFLSGVQIWWARKKGVLRYNLAREQDLAAPVIARAGE